MKTNTQQRMIDAVSEDSDRTTYEKETSFHFTKPDDTVRVQSAEAGIMRRLLAHPEFDAVHVVLADGSARPTLPSDEFDEYDGEQVVFVVGDAPVGCLKLSAKPRTTGSHANVITNYDPTEDGGET